MYIFLYLIILNIFLSMLVARKYCCISMSNGCSLTIRKCVVMLLFNVCRQGLTCIVKG